MKKRAELLADLAKAESFSEQRQILASIEALDSEAARQVQADRDLDWADTTVRRTLSPVAVHEMHTAATSWLGEVDTDGQDYHQQVIAKAASWYGRVSPMVKADAEEFEIQATGYMRREASQYGRSANAAYAAGLEYLSFLRQREGASGLPQIEQTVAPDGVTSQPTPLPPDVFDNFAPPVHPINEGVSGTETSERNPLLQEIEGIGNGGQQETLHSTAPVTTQPGTRLEASLVEAPSVAIGYVMNLDEFKARQRAAAKDVTDGTDYPDPSEARTLEELGYVSPLGVGDVDVVAAPGAGDSGTERLFQNSSRKQAADGDSQGIDDGRYSGGVGADDEDGSAAIGKLMDATGMSEQEVRQRYPNPQAALALLDAAQTKQSAKHAVDERGKVRAPEDYNGGPPPKGYPLECYSCGSSGDAGKFLSTNARQCPDCGSYEVHSPDAQANWSKRKRSAKTAASGLDQIQQTVAPDGVTQRPTPLPADVAFPLIDQTEMSSEQLLDSDPRAAVEKSSALSRHENPFMNAYMHGQEAAQAGTPHVPGSKSQTAYPMEVEPQFHADFDRGYRSMSRGSAAKVADMREGGQDCRSCGERLPGAPGGGTPAGVDGRPPSEDKRVCTNCGVANYLQHAASLSFTPADAMSHPEFYKGYGFGRNWRPGWPLVAQGSAEFEAGLYAGITDNAPNQHAWLAEHAKQAVRYPRYAKRIERHDALTKRLGAKTAGIYVQANPALLAPIVEAVAPAVIGGILGGGDDEEKTASKTATTETDLNTSAPGTSPSPVGDTPINGPGRPGPLAGYDQPAAAGGPAPYNGAQPLGQPVVPGAVVPPSVDDAAMLSRGLPPNPFASQQTVAFRRRVQAGLLSMTRKG